MWYNTGMSSVWGMFVMMYKVQEEGKMENFIRYRESKQNEKSAWKKKKICIYVCIHGINEEDDALSIIYLDVRF